MLAGQFMAHCYVPELAVICIYVRLRDQRFHQDTKTTINKAISVACRKERKRDLESNRKEGDRSSEDSESYEYLKMMPLHDARIWMR